MLIINKGYKLIFIYSLLPYIDNDYPAATSPAINAMSNPGKKDCNTSLAYPTRSAAPAKKDLNPPPDNAPINSSIPNHLDLNYPSDSTYLPCPTSNST